MLANHLPVPYDLCFCVNQEKALQLQRFVCSSNNHDTNDDDDDTNDDDANDDDAKVMPGVEDFHSLRLRTTSESERDSRGGRTSLAGTPDRVEVGAPKISQSRRRLLLGPSPG